MLLKIMNSQDLCVQATSQVPHPTNSNYSRAGSKNIPETTAPVLQRAQKGTVVKIPEIL